MGPNNVFKAGSILCSHDDATLGTYMFEEDTTTGKAGDGVNLGDGVKPKYVKGLAEGYPIQLPDHYYSSLANNNGASIMPLTRKKFTLAFPANPGKLRQPEIDLYLDGSRPTVTTGTSFTLTTGTKYANDVHTWVYPNGFTGEDVDLVPDLCVGVTATLKAHSTVWTEVVVDTAQAKLLKACLGDADGDPSNNNEIGFTTNDKDTNEALFNWDYGIELEGSDTFAMDSVLHPHLIKLGDKSTTSQTRLCNTTGTTITGVDNINHTGYCRAGDAAPFYGVLYYLGDPGKFYIMSRAFQAYPTTAEFNIFTTTGYLSLASKKVDVFTSFGDIDATATAAATVEKYDLVKLDLKSFYSNVVYTMGKTAMGSTNIQSVDCETQSSNTGPDNVYQCIEKGDYVMIFDLAEASSVNPMYPNMYQVMKISRENREAVPDVQTMVESVDRQVDVYGDTPNDAHFEKLRYQIVLDYGMNARYNKASLGVGTSNKARIYKFTPPTTAVTWVGQCSNRGLCDGGSGICQCFPGYSGDDCSTMNALAQ